MLIDDLARVASRSGESIALVCGESRVTYAQLWRSIEAVHGFLRRAGLERGDRVALILDNGWEYAAVLYGVFAANGIAVALNAAARAEDLAGWLTHSGARFAFVSRAHRRVVDLLGEQSALKVVTVDADAQPGDAESWSRIQHSEAAGSQHPKPEPNDAALILYTSGTSGRPKGVTLSHRNLAANVASILEYLKLLPTDRIVNVLPFYYSYGNSILHTHLIAGACVVLEPNLVYPHKVMETIVRERATGFAGVPSTFALITARVRLEDFDLASLRYVLQAGGALPLAVLDRFRDNVRHAAFFVMYGQTEATARISYLPPGRLADKRGSVGVPVAGVSVEIRREDGSHARPGEVGGIWVRGDNVMLGYWQAPDLTSSVIVNNWLHTGDTGYLDEEGFLYISGRRSDIIKTGSHRVQPQDIEAAIAELDAVEEVAVVGADDEILGQVIRAVIVLRTGRTVSEMEVKAHCRARLAGYKIPKYVEFARQLPKTSSGKLQRHLLAK